MTTVNKFLNNIKYSLKQANLEHLKLLKDYKDVSNFINSTYSNNQSVLAFTSLISLANYKKNQPVEEYYKKQLIKASVELAQTVEKQKPKQSKFTELSIEAYGKLPKTKKQEYAYKKFINDPDKRWRTRRKDYFTKLLKGVITSPKVSTLSMYKIVEFGNSYRYEEGSDGKRIKKPKKEYKPRKLPRDVPPGVY